uniref:Uncharacterized protein n=1 Tax=Physcomitrium patens TaxID=3218 RepID=A0A2K1K0E0_PHYPA|nr:hypothetical protein PHYPA_014348 [Physcomitrium patens]
MKSLFTDVRRGVLNLYKLADVLSHEVVAWTWCIVKVDKTQHSGTLDPADNVQVDEVDFVRVYREPALTDGLHRVNAPWGCPGSYTLRH